MPEREIIHIDEALCDGCGDCVPACAEGAIQIVDGKARLISEVYCDGLGVCLGHCPQGAITVVRREAEAFDEAAVESHLRAQAPSAPAPVELAAPASGGCPGSRPQSLTARPSIPVVGTAGFDSAPAPASELRHWPVQLHLVPPTAPFFQGQDVVLAADCVAFAMGDFHQRVLAGRALAIACPKLDSHQEVYVEKLVAMIDQARIASLTVVVMEVPCCSGLARLAQQAVARAERPVDLRVMVIGTRGDLLAEQQLATA